MKKLFMKKFLCLCGLALALTGCYREEIDSLKAEVDALRINDLETMVSNMGSSVKDLMSLSDVLSPAVKDLQEQKENILKEISSMQGKMGEDEKASTEMQAQLLSLQTQLGIINAALDAINKANLSGRIDDLKAFVNAANSDIKGRIDELDALQQTLATLDALSALEEAVNAIKADVNKIQNDFDAEFLDALDRNKTEIISWITQESETIKKLFNDYYTNKQVDALLDVLRATDTAQDSEIKAMQSQVNDLDSALRKVIEDAVAGSEKKLAQRIDSIEQNLDALVERANGLEKRIEALEELYDVIGDYKNYQGNLIDAIKALQNASADRQKETDELATLLNTLKFVLTTGEGNYYDLAKIVADIAANTGSAADHEKRIAYLEDLVGTLAGVDALNGLDDQISELRDAINGLSWDIDDNADAIEDLVKRVDGIVAKWSDEVFAQIKNNTDELAKLKEQDIALQAAIDKAVSDGQEADKKEHEEVIGLIAKINENIAALIAREELAEKGISDINEAVKKINELLEGCNVGEIKGLQNCLANLDSRIKSLNDEIAKIWAVIGSEELSIKGSLINAINILDARFGDLGDKTVKELIDALNADLVIINATIEGIKGGETTESLTSLKKLIDNLNTVVGGKVDAKTVDELKDTVAGIQKELKDFMEKYDETLKDYLLKADAEKTYATIVAVNEYIDLYTKLVGELKTNVDTVLGQVAALNARLTIAEGTISGYNTEIGKINEGIGKINEEIGKINGDIITIFSRIGIENKFTNGWTTDLISAVNKLHELVGDKSVSEQATEIAQQQANTIAAGMVDDLIKAILGKEGTGADIKTLLDGFASSVSTLEGEIEKLSDMIGDLSELQKEDGNPDIAHMISNIKAVLAQLDATYAAKQHTHGQAEIEGLLDALKIINDNLDGVSDKLDELDTYVRVTLVDIINKLDAKFEGYTTPDAVKVLITEAESVLAAAILGDKDNGGEYFTKYFSELNLKALSDRIDDIINTNIHDIIKDGGKIDEKAQALIDAALAELKIDEYLKTADFDTKIVEILNDYATNDSVKDAKAIAATFATLKIVLGEKEYTYDKFNEAVQDVYNELQSKYSALQQEITEHIEDFKDAQEAFNTLKSEYDTFFNVNFTDVKAKLYEIYPLIGAGFEGKTITGVIEEILGDITGIGTLISGIKETLDGVVDREATDKGLIDDLEDVRDKLISALFGGTIPPSGIPDGGYVADFEKRIAALEDTLSKIGFDTIKNSEGKTLSEVISGINTQIAELKNTIGGDYSSTKTVASALEAFKTALGDYVKGSVYEPKVSGIETELQNLINALTGKTGTDGKTADVKNLSELSTTLAGLISRLDDFNGETGKKIEDFINELYSGVHDLEGIVGDLTGTGFENLAKEIDDLYKLLNDTDVLGGIAYDNAAAILRERMGVTGLLDMIGNLRDLKTTYKTDLVGAINEIFNSLHSGEFASQADLNNLMLAILYGGEGTGEYSSLKALGDAIDLLREAIGEMPVGFDYSNAFDAIEKLEEYIRTNIGTNPGESTVWDAIASLKEALDKAEWYTDKGLTDYLHSMSFISDYADGKANIPSNTNRTLFGDLVMKFNVAAAPKFGENLESGAYSVSGIIREVATRAAGDETTVSASAKLDGGILTVTMESADVIEGMAGKTAALVAVVITNKANSDDKFTSQYIPLSYVTTSLRLSSNLPSGLSYRNNTLTVSSPNGGVFSNVFNTNALALSISGGDWATIDNETLALKISPNDTGSDRSQAFTVTAADGTGVSLSFTISQECKKLTARFGQTSGTTFSVSASRNNQTITIGNNYGYDGSYTITGYTGNYDSNPSISGNTITFKTTYETGERRWAGGTIDVAAADGNTLHITLNRRN